MPASSSIVTANGYQPFAGIVYAFRTFDSSEYRYVGQTRQSLQLRMKRHWAQARGGRKTPLYDWMRTDPGILEVPVEFVGTSLEDLGEAEKRWIARLRADGHRLLNLTEGGAGPAGYTWTDEQREAARRRSTGRQGVHRFGDENPFFGRNHSDEQRARWSASRTGTMTGAENPNFGKFGSDHPAFGSRRSAETRRILSEAKRGENNPNFGKVMSAEDRRIRSEKLAGRPMPSSVRSAHTRHHTNKGVFKDTCRHCQDDRLAAEGEQE